MEQKQISELSQKIASRDYHGKWLKVGGIGLGISVLNIAVCLLINTLKIKDIIEISDSIENVLFIFFLGGLIMAIIFLGFAIYHLIRWLIFRNQIKKLTNPKKLVNKMVEVEREREREREREQSG